LRVYALAVATLAALSLLSAGPVNWNSSGWAIGVLSLVAFAGERFRVPVGGRQEESVSLFVIILAGVLFGPLAGGVVGVASFLLDARGPLLKWLVYSSTRALTGLAAGYAAVACAGRISNSSVALIAGAAAATVIAEVADRIFAIIVGTLRGAVESPAELLVGLVRLVATSAPIYVLALGVIGVSYTLLSPWTLLIVVAPMFGMHRLFGLYREQARLVKDLKLAHGRLQDASLSFATALVTSLDARDAYTAGHSVAVAIYARDIAIELGLTAEDHHLAYRAGLVHDIGKIALPLGLLEKQGPLDEEEREVMERHSEVGSDMLRQIEEFEEIAEIVRHHHERFDGMGYPDGIRGEGIPLLARVLAVADAYDAMISDRPYRKAMPSWMAQSRLNEGVGSQFDQVAMSAFLSILARQKEPYRMARHEEFVERRSLLLQIA